MDARSTSAVISEMRSKTRLPIWAKLTPNTGDCAAIARAAEDAGADAVVVANTILAMSIDIDAVALHKLREDWPAMIAESCDLGELAQIELVVPRVIEALDGLDVLVNNGGIAGPTAPVEQVTPS